MISAVVIAVALLMVIATPAGATGPITNVVNGDEAAPGTFPYLAWIYYSDGIDNRTCTGSVVAGNVVLTAAHCVLRNDGTNNLDPARFVVATGNVHHLAEPHTTSTVQSFAVAPNFWLEPGASHPAYGDAAVLILNQSTPSPAVRLATSQVWSTGTPVVMAGWGESGIPNAGDALRVGRSTVQSTSYCTAHLGEFDATQLLCIQDTTEHRYSGCHGDSGGPLLMTAPGTVDEPLEIGIQSFGPDNCTPELPSYLTRADVVDPWVEAEIAANPPPPPSPPSPAPAPTPTGDATPREPRPVVSAGKARAEATATLRRRLGPRFAGRREYKIVCDEVNLHKRECRVHWKTDDTRYRGIVTVFGVFVSGAVVWEAPFTVHATTCVPPKAGRGRPVCTGKTFRG